MGATYPRNMDQIRAGAPRPCLSCYDLFVANRWKNKGINKTAKPTAHSAFERELRNHEKSERENMGNRNEILNRQSVQFDIGKKSRELWQEQSVNYNNRRKNKRNFKTDDSEAREIIEDLNQNRTLRSTVCNMSTRQNFTLEKV